MNVDTIYKLALKYLESKMGNKITDSDQLHKMGRKLFGKKFKGVYPSDKALKLTQKQPYAIVNLDNSDEFGSHWTAVGLNNGDLLFYDSFGRKASKILPSIFKGGKQVIDTEDDVEQDLNGKKESNCGQRSLASLVVLDQWGRDMFLKL